MQNLKKALRTGGKGSPRIPPKKTSNKTDEVNMRVDQTLAVLKKTSVSIESPLVIMQTKEGVYTFKKPEMRCFVANKNTPIAYFMRGKGDFVPLNIPAEGLNKNESGADAGTFNGEKMPDDFDQAVKEMMEQESGNLNVGDAETGKEINDIMSQGEIKEIIKNKFDEEWSAKGSYSSEDTKDEASIQEVDKKDEKLSGDDLSFNAPGDKFEKEKSTDEDASEIKKEGDDISENNLTNETDKKSS